MYNLFTKKLFKIVIINKIDTNNQHDKFRDHRHDQSIWSILCKLNNVNILTHDKNPIHQTHYRE